MLSSLCTCEDEVWVFARLLLCFRGYSGIIDYKVTAMRWKAI